jgi:hypothetical protein
MHPAHFVTYCCASASLHLAPLFVLLLQGDKPLVYHADDLIILIKAAGAASDTALIADAWARLQQDVQQKPTTAASSSGYHSTAQSNSHVDQKPGQPSPAAFKAVVKAYVDSKDFGKALQLVAELEKVYGNTRATSVYGGLSFLPIDELKKEEDIAAVFTQLKARKVRVAVLGLHGGIGCCLLAGCRHACQHCALNEVSTAVHASESFGFLIAGG